MTRFHRATADSVRVNAAIAAPAVLAGAATAIVATHAGTRAIYYVAILGLLAIGGMVMVTRKEPLRFGFLALIACFPVASALVPPGRFGITVFDGVMILLAVGFFGRKMLLSTTAGVPTFPTRSLLIAWLLFFPCVALSQFPLVSLLHFTLVLALYAFFLLALEELRRPGGFERLVVLFSVVLLLMAVGLFVDHFLRVNLSLRGSNLNQLSYSGGIEIWRAGGFFQDPQQAGTFLACLSTFLLVLSIRGRFRGMKMRFLVWSAIPVGLAALTTTVSRGAIAACVLISGMALFAFNGWKTPVKLILMAGTLSAAAAITVMPAAILSDLLPSALHERFLHWRTELDVRFLIWFDTWDMFANYPLTGIGPGSFSHYLLETRPTVFNFYDIGTAEGVTYIPVQPENGYLKILYEGGLAGSLAALVVGGDAVRRALGVAARGKSDPHVRTEAIAALAALATFAATFVTLFTLSEPRVAALFMFLLAVIWHGSLPQAAHSGSQWTTS
jgi:O-antigen ligase